MNASELIGKLEKLPPDTEVLAVAPTCCGDSEYVESVLVRVDGQVVLVGKEEFDRER